MSSPVSVENEQDGFDDQTVDELLSQIALVKLTDDDLNEISHLSISGGDSNLYESDSSRTMSLPLSTGLNACGVFQCPGTTHTPSRKPVERSHSVMTSTQMTSPFSGSLDQSWPNFDSSWLPTTGVIGGHRHLGRTSSDPLTIDDTSSIFAADNGLAEMRSTGGACRYKTELCRPFEEHGVCKYGEKCQFAHGRHELRVVSRHPKYKTDLCKTYHSTGLCPYGARCHFIHETEEEAGVYRECQRLLREERLRILKEQELLLQAQRQQKQQELLITALLQASRQRHLSQLSTPSSATSPNKYSTNVPSFASQSPLPRSPFCSSQSVCDSLDSVTSSSSPSSVSESPSSSPSLSMFCSDELNNVQTTGESVFKTASSSSSKFILPEFKQSSLLQQLVSADSNVIAPHIDLFPEVKEVRPCTFSQKESAFGINAASNLETDSSYLTESFLASLSQLPEDTTIKDILLVAEVFRAVKASQKAVNNSHLCYPGQNFKDNFFNIEQFSA